MEGNGEPIPANAQTVPNTPTKTKNANATGSSRLIQFRKSLGRLIASRKLPPVRHASRQSTWFKPVSYTHLTLPTKA